MKYLRKFESIESKSTSEIHDNLEIFFSDFLYESYVDEWHIVYRYTDTWYTQELLDMYEPNYDVNKITNVCIEILFSGDINYREIKLNLLRYIKAKANRLKSIGFTYSSVTDNDYYTYPDGTKTFGDSIGIYLHHNIGWATM